MNRCSGLFACALILCLRLPGIAMAAPPTKTAGGELRQIDGITVLRIEGDAEQRGRAHGFLLAPQIIALFEGYLEAEDVSGGPERYQSTVQMMQHVFEIAPRYREELRGMLAGIEERQSGDTTIRSLGRKLTLGDLIAINCVPDAVGFGCSSFSAWGRLTPEGHTITGRNLDWHTIDALLESQVVIASVPAEGSKDAGWVSITWPGLIVCLTGMNEHGVTVAMHDVHVGSPMGASGITPRGFALREAIERAGAASFQKDVLGIFRQRRVLVGNNVHVTAPFDGEPASRVFEYDGFVDRKGGVVVRSPAADKARSDAKKPSDGSRADWQVTTNHYRRRDQPEACGRYKKLEQALSSAEASTVDVDRAWSLLDSVAVSGGITTYQSVVFEPNARRIHVSFSTKSDSAPTEKRVTLDATELLGRRAGAVAADRP